VWPTRGASRTDATGPVNGARFSDGSRFSRCRTTCEVCGFDFERRYGLVGRGFIECHHVTPLAETDEIETTLDDLTVVCAN
jgi:hypothetical protein